MTDMPIERCASPDHPGWLALRMSLWSDGREGDHRQYMEMMLARPERFLALVAHDGNGLPTGFIEGSIRSDYVNGTETSPVGFVEGVYVIPAARHHGLARALFAAVADWARAHGCRELASDALIDNVASQQAHLALGFRETERVVYYVKRL